MKRCGNKSTWDPPGKVCPQVALQVARMLCLGIAIVLSGCGPRASLGPPQPQVAQNIRALAGAQTRVVWVQDIAQTGDVAGLNGLTTALIGFDTEDGRGERLILTTPGAYTKPLFTAHGDRVVFTQYRRGIPRIGEWNPGDKVMFSRTRRIEARIVDWDGSGLRTLAPGFAIAVWTDPATGKEWVYVQAGPHRGLELKRNAVYRYPIDEPGDGELVWDETPVDAMGAGSFQLSADGKRAAGLFPWPDAGMLDLEHKVWTRIGSGCWPALAPDNSYRPWIFDGSHRHLLMATDTGRITAQVSIVTAEGMSGGEAYHPRWSNEPRILAVTRPYTSQVRKDLARNPGVEVVLGRFNESYTKVESWVTVTANDRGDYFPEVWVARDPVRGPFADRVQVVAQAGDRPVVWPGDSGGLVFLWEDGEKKNEVFDVEKQRRRLCRTTLHGFARYGRYKVMKLADGGSFVSDGGASEMRAALQASNELTVEATVTSAARTAQSASLIQADSPTTRADFALVQDGDQLVFTVTNMGRAGPMERRLTLGVIEPGVTRHAAVTYSPYGMLAGYLDGVKVAEVNAEPGGFSDWSMTRLVFGGAEDGRASWTGELDGIAIYSVPLDAQRIARHAALNVARRADRKPVERAVVRATLRETTPVPSPASIEPYRRCLIVHRYDVEEAISGHVEADRLLVAHWGILDGRTLDEEQPRVGETYVLELEPFDEHGELLSERLDMSTTEFELPLYFHPSLRHEREPDESRLVKSTG